MRVVSQNRDFSFDFDRTVFWMQDEYVYARIDSNDQAIGKYDNNPEYKAQIDAEVEEELRIAAEYRACKTQEEMEELDRKYGVEVIH